MNKSFADWLDYIYSLHPCAIDLGLSRVQKVANKLGGLQPPCPVVMVAGTNGKGSLVKLTQALLQRQGLRVGCYTSPHLLSFCERITIDGASVSEAALIQHFVTVEAARGETTLSFFEFTTIAALLHFQQASLDVVILEVGLGGRLDAVNIIDADLAVLTTLGLDHTDLLGDNLESIGREKAGIFRSNKLAIIGVASSALPKSVGAKLQELTAPSLQLERDFSYQRQQQHWQLTLQGMTFNDLPLGKLPMHSQALALVVVQQLAAMGLGQGIMLEPVCEVLANTTLLGRMQQLEHQGIAHLLDVAHNQDSCAKLADELQAMQGVGRLHAVFAALADKAIIDMVEPLLDLFASWSVGGLLKAARGQSGSAIAAKLQQAAGLQDKKIEVAVYATVAQAHQAALRLAKPGDTIVVFGSFYTVAETLGELV